MARYKHTEAEAGQGMFLTVNLSEQLLPGTFEFTLDKLVDTEIDMSGFAAHYHNDTTGRLAINPAVLLKLVLYGYSKGILSSRKLEDLSKTNIIAKALTDDSEMDHSTIADFVSSNSENIKKVFAEILLVCQELGLIRGEMFAVDGCRLSSNASKEWSGTIGNLRKKAAKLEAYAEKLLEAHKENDRKKPRQETEREEKAIARIKHKAAYIRRFLAGAKERVGVSGKEIQSNVTDNESAKIKGPHGIIQGYNGITVADSANQIIVAAEACGTDYEGGEFPSILDTLTNNLKEVSGTEKPLEKALVLADTNYFSHDNLQAAQDKDIAVIIPDPHFRSRDERFNDREHHLEDTKETEKSREKEWKYDIHDFTHDEADNSYTCPTGKKLVYRGKTRLRHNRTAHRWTTKAGECLGCEHIGRCMATRNGKEPHKTIYLTEDNEEWLCEQMRRKIDTPEGRALYSHRMEIIEPVFANIEYCKGINRLTLRGKKKVNGQWLLYCIVHNIGKCAGVYAA